MKFPFFSIIIPTYNRAHTIKTPIDSIIRQTFTDWELIIVDDGSTDDTLEIVASYNDSRIRYVWQENQKESAARNHGIRLAQAEWICFQDSDDEYLPHHLEVLHQAIQNHPDYKVFKTGLIIQENGVEVHRTGILSASKLDTFPYEGFTTGAYHFSIFKNIRFDERIHIGEDLHFLMKTGLNYPFFVLPEWTCICHYNPHSSGGTGKRYAENLANQRFCLDDILSWNHKLNLTYLRRKRCLNPLLLLAGHFTYKRSAIPAALMENIRTFFHFPLEYTQTIIRIIYVKIGEWTGLYRTKGRFLS